MTYEHACEKCGTSFQSTRQRQRFCSQECSGYKNKTTSRQYALIDGNLALYLNRLLYKNNNIEAKSRVNLTREELLRLWQNQGGCCAISGVPMTLRAKQGEKFPYNASIDRIVAGGAYEAGNVQLVCTIINSLMKDFSKEDFIRVCIAVARKHSEKP